MKLLCDTNPMAFGSTASLAAILPELEDATEVVAMGRDISLELLLRTTPRPRVLQVDVKVPAHVAAVVARESPHAALVISNLANLSVYREANVPVFFVDVLFWYGARKDEAQWKHFERGFASDFPGVRERVRSLDWASLPTIVGPLLRRLSASGAERRGTLVNLGGVRSVFVSPARMRTGLVLISHVLRAIHPSLPAGNVVIATGADAAEVLRPLLPAAMTVRSLSPLEYDERLQRSALLLTIPGLNAVLEGMAACVPLAFLPPLNVSQCLQLRCYRQAGVGALGVELDRYTSLAIPEFVLDEGTATTAVIEALERIVASSVLSQAMADAVEAQLGTAVEQVPARRAFVDRLGTPGAPTIARALSSWWEARGP